MSYKNNSRLAIKLTLLYTLNVIMFYKAALGSWHIAFHVGF
jgi:hypothetical protein